MNCTECGTELSIEWKYCAKCGKKTGLVDMVIIEEKTIIIDDLIDCGHCNGTGTCRVGNKNNSSASCSHCSYVSMGSPKWHTPDYHRISACSYCNGIGKRRRKDVI